MASSKEDGENNQQQKKNQKTGAHTDSMELMYGVIKSNEKWSSQDE